MNGDEDLKQDITMKGEKFHYAQDVPEEQVTLQVTNFATFADVLSEDELFATGMNGDEDLK